MSSDHPGERTPMGRDPEGQHGRRKMILAPIVIILVGLTIMLIIGLIL